MSGHDGYKITVFFKVNENWSCYVMLAHHEVPKTWQEDFLHIPTKEYTNADNVLPFSSTDFIHYISAHTSEPTAVKIKHTLPVWTWFSR